MTSQYLFQYCIHQSGIAYGVPECRTEGNVSDELLLPAVFLGLSLPEPDRSKCLRRVLDSAIHCALIN